MAKLMRNVSYLTIAIIHELLQQFATIKLYNPAIESNSSSETWKCSKQKSFIAIQQRNSANINSASSFLVENDWLVIQIFATAWIVLQYAVFLVCFFGFVSPLFPGAFKGDWLTRSHLSLVKVGRQGSGSWHCCLLSDRALTRCSTKRLCPVSQNLHVLWWHWYSWKGLYNRLGRQKHGTFGHRIPRLWTLK